MGISEWLLLIFFIVSIPVGISIMNEKPKWKK